MLIDSIWEASIIIVCLILLKISFDDVSKRTVKHRYLVLLAVLFLLFWTVQPNYKVLPYFACIFLIGFVLHLLGVLGAGDSKLAAVLSLGIDPAYVSLMLLFAVALGGVMALIILIYGLFTDLRHVREKGIPYAVPICMSGGCFVLLSYIGWFGSIS